jgi:hypothetical protein
VIVTERLLVVSATLTALTTTDLAVVTSGAVYSPVELITPTVLFPPTTPSTAQVTRLSALYDTVPVNCCVAPDLRIADAGLMATVKGWTVMDVAVDT